MKFSFEEEKIGKLSFLYVEVEDIFLKNGYLISFIDKCFKTFLDRLYLKRPQYLTAEKKTLTLALPFLEESSLQNQVRTAKSSQKDIRLM